MFDSGKSKILIVDDSDINREILGEMLADKYESFEASGGKEAIAILEKGKQEFSVVLLDAVMPEIDGFGVLEYMKRTGKIESTPVIMISAEGTPDFIDRAYSLGVSDYIGRPFNVHIVRRRVANAIFTHMRQEKLSEVLAENIYQGEKSKNMLISILSQIVEFRNFESGSHVFNVSTITRLILQNIISKTDKYKIDGRMIYDICAASALHDIGKIAIDDKILNKPGKLTNEEFGIMKTHTAKGAEMIQKIASLMNDPFLDLVYSICRWHHEKYDGKGYPDGLVGDDIPIGAQVVSLADVYDALTSDRCYKKAFTHEEAVQMILNGECGKFNPLILESFKELGDSIRSELSGKTGWVDPKALSLRLDNEDELSATVNRDRRLSVGTEMFGFVMEESDEIILSISDDYYILRSSKGAMLELDIDDHVLSPYSNEKLNKVFGEGFINSVINEAKSTDSENPTFSMKCCAVARTGKKEYSVNIKAIWWHGRINGIVMRFIEA